MPKIMIAVAVGDIDRGQVLAARRDPFHCGVRLLDGKKGVDENSIPFAIDKCGRCRHPHPFLFPRWQVAVETLGFCHKDVPFQRSRYWGSCHFDFPFERSTICKLQGRPVLSLSGGSLPVIRSRKNILHKLFNRSRCTVLRRTRL